MSEKVSGHYRGCNALNKYMQGGVDPNEMCTCEDLAMTYQDKQIAKVRTYKGSLIVSEGAGGDRFVTLTDYRQLLSRMETMEGVITRGGKHTDDCLNQKGQWIIHNVRIGYDNNPPEPCFCGLDDLLKALSTNKGEQHKFGCASWQYGDDKCNCKESNALSNKEPK